MNIDDLTLGQMKSLSSLLNTANTEDGLNDMTATATAPTTAPATATAPATRTNKQEY